MYDCFKTTNYLYSLFLDVHLKKNECMVLAYSMYLTDFSKRLNIVGNFRNLLSANYCIIEIYIRIKDRNFINMYNG